LGKGALPAPTIKPPAGKRAVPNSHARHFQPGIDGHVALGASCTPSWSGILRGM